MEFAYRPEDWQPLFATVAGASAALTGLVFVGLSLNLKRILGNPTHRARCRESLGGLLCLLVYSIVALVPGQGAGALGAELIALSALFLVVSFRLQAQTLTMLNAKRRLSWFLRIGLIDCATLLIAFGGFGLVFHCLGGLLWLVPSSLFYFVWPTLNAWSLVTKAAE